MGEGSESAVFVDTSIEIGRRVHRPEIQESIRQRLSTFPHVVTGLQVRNEFKRRLLEEAQYLLGQLELRKSYQKVKRHVEENLRYDDRKRNICIQSLEVVFERKLSDSAEGIEPEIEPLDAELTERAKLYLRELLRFGMSTFDANIHRIVAESGCICATQPVKEQKPFLKYDFGVKKCSKTGSQCRIGDWLTKNRELLTRIADQVASLAENEKTGELRVAEKFIREFLDNPADVQLKNPCQTVGDLIIALESREIANFYTMNVKESRHLCQVLSQRLIYRNPNPDHGEVEFAAP